MAGCISRDRLLVCREWPTNGQLPFYILPFKDVGSSNIFLHFLAEDPDAAGRRSSAKNLACLLSSKVGFTEFLKSITESKCKHECVSGALQSN